MGRPAWAYVTVRTAPPVITRPASAAVPRDILAKAAVKPASQVTFNPFNNVSNVISGKPHVCIIKLNCSCPYRELWLALPERM